MGQDLLLGKIANEEKFKKGQAPNEENSKVQNGTSTK
jgi:hypothetical protein